MNDEIPKGWFAKMWLGVLTFLSLGNRAFDDYLALLVKILVIFLVLTVLFNLTGHALSWWVDVLHINEATSAVSNAFSEAVQNAQPVVPTDLPVDITE